MGIAPAIDSDIITTINQNNDLLNRVKRNAAELRYSWESGKGEIVSFEIKPVKRVKKQGGAKRISKAQNKSEKARELPDTDQNQEAAPILQNPQVNTKQDHVYASALFPQPNTTEAAALDTAISMEQYLINKGLSFIDKRDKGGALWVIGGSELNPYMKELANNGYDFSFAPKGGKATKNRPGWYYK